MAPSILLVDDDDDLRDILGEVLTSAGYQVRLARDGQAGLDLMAHALPDLIVLDVEMPTLTGPEMACRMLVRDAGMEAIPIVLTSGVTALAEVAARVGTPYFMPKPYDLEAMLALVGRALAERTPPRPTLAVRPG